MKKLAWIPLLCAAACVEAPEGEGPPDEEIPDELVDEPRGDVPIFLGPLDGRENNGPFLLGRTVDALGVANARHFRVQTTAMRAGTPVTVDVLQARLSSSGHVGDDPWFDGVIFHEAGGGTGRLRVDSAAPTDTLWQTHYFLSYRTAPGATWGPYCDGGAPAMPVLGAYNAKDVRQPDTAITFSCADGAVFKCTAASFKPGDQLTDLFWQKHQACVQMMEADYCANGVPHTYAGTDVYVRDLSTGGAPQLAEEDLYFSPSIPAPPPPAGPFFEAAWLTPWLPGAGLEIESQRPFCLSKLRWASLEPAAGCGIPDPRYEPDALYCEDYTYPQMAAVTGIRVLNKSGGMDAGLHEWSDGNAYVSTVDGFYSEMDQPDPPISGYTDAEHVGVLIRGIPPGVAPHELAEVRLFRNATSYVLALNPPQGYAPYGGFQGRVFINARPDTVPLTLYTNGTGYRTRVGQPAGYVPVQTLGYIYR